MPIGIPGYVHLVIFGVLIPYSAVRSKKVIESGAFPLRRRYFVAVLVQTAFFALLSTAVAWKSGVPLFPHRAPNGTALLAGVIFLAIAVPFGWTRWVKAVRNRERLIALFMPVTRTERLLWIATAITAGIGEEITWRGVQTALLIRLTNDIPIAIAVCIVIFAVAHAVQGWKSAAVIAIFAAGFHALVFIAGSLYVAMIVHVIYDIVAGLSYSHLGRKMGYVIEEVITAAVPDPATHPV